MVREAVRGQVSGFVEFIRERGVMGLAIGFVLGSSVQKVVTALVDDIISPFINLIAGRADTLREFTVGPFLVGDFFSVLVDFLILAAVVYFVFRSIGLQKLDKKKDEDLTRREALEKLVNELKR